MNSRGSAPFWLLGWALLVLAMLLILPPVPIDQTRYLSVAWEMWQNHNIWVPHVNGHSYDGKPPLLFWLIDLGWLVFGVSSWWARLVAPLFGLAGLFLTATLARRIWDDRQIAALAPILLLGTLYWALFASFTMMDLVLTTFVLLALLGLVRVWRGGGPRNFWLTGVALGLGVLTKGPVVFLPVASVVLLAPWWMGDSRPAGLEWKHWFRGALLATGIALVVVLLWLVPMAISAGWSYFWDMTWGQTAGYLGSGPVALNGHHRPWWWYLPLLPIMLFPWVIMPSAWRAAVSRGSLADPGVRLCLAWALPVFTILSLISGKQPHYLLPLFPALALLLARGLTVSGRTLRLTVPGAVYVGLGLFWLVFPLLASHYGHKVPWMAHSSTLLALAIGSLLLLLGVLMITWRKRFEAAAGIRILATSNWLMLVLVVGAIMGASWPAYDLRPASAFLHKAVDDGAALAIMDTNYQGQFNFLARLKTPVTELDSKTLQPWAEQHPQGYVIAYYDPRHRDPSADPQPAYRQLYRGKAIAIWSTAQLAAHPELATATH